MTNCLGLIFVKPQINVAVQMCFFCGPVVFATWQGLGEHRFENTD